MASFSSKPENVVPSELRYIMFRSHEVVEAVKQYRRRLGVPLPHGGVVQCGPESEQTIGGKVGFRITFVPDGVKGSPPGQEILLIEGPALAAALILYCRDHRIPMSATADKSLERRGDQLCLVARYNSKHNAEAQAEQIRL